MKRKTSVKKASNAKGEGEAKKGDDDKSPRGAGQLRDCGQFCQVNAIHRREQKEDEEDRQAARMLEMGGQIQSNPVQWLLVAQMVTLGIRTARHWRRGTDTEERLKVTPRYGNGKEPREQRRGPLACWICGVEPTRALEPCWWTSSQKKKSSANWQQVPSGLASRKSEIAK